MMQDVWILFEETSDQMGTSRPIAVFRSEQAAKERQAAIQRRTFLKRVPAFVD